MADLSEYKVLALSGIEITGYNKIKINKEFVSEIIPVADELFYVEVDSLESFINFACGKRIVLFEKIKLEPIYSQKNEFINKIVNPQSFQMAVQRKGGMTLATFAILDIKICKIVMNNGNEYYVFKE